MKPICLILVAILGFAMPLAAPLANAATELPIEFFYEQLEPYGDWFEVGDYGYCWHPRDVDADWRPYSVGRWVYTDAGWTWESDEPFGWAVYHYGRWAEVEQIGWVWVPGSEWGPAWVSWRRSPQYIGWAPLPPEAVYQPGSGFSNRVDAEYDIGPDYYCFVNSYNFGAPRLRTVLVEPQQNITIIQETRNITRITTVNNIVVNEGPRYEEINREVAQPIPRLRLERRQEIDPRSVRPEELRTRVEGNALHVLAPPVQIQAKAPPPRVKTRVDRPQIDRGWKRAGPAPEVERVRAHIQNEAAAGGREGVPPSVSRTPSEPTASPRQAGPKHPSEVIPPEARTPPRETPSAPRSSRAHPAPPPAPAATPPATPQMTPRMERPLREQQQDHNAAPQREGTGRDEVLPQPATGRPPQHEQLRQDRHDLQRQQRGEGQNKQTQEHGKKPQHKGEEPSKSDGKAKDSD